MREVETEWGSEGGSNRSGEYETTGWKGERERERERATEREGERGSDRAGVGAPACDESTRRKGISRERNQGEKSVPPPCPVARPVQRGNSDSRLGSATRIADSDRRLGPATPMNDPDR